jgi:hypothetical protein
MNLAGLEAGQVKESNQTGAIMTVDHVLPHDLDDLYGPGAEDANTEAATKRIYVLKFEDETQQVRLMDDAEFEYQQEAALLASGGQGYWELYRDPAQAETIKELSASLELAIRYLEHPDVQAMPFALHPSAVVERAKAVLNKAQS